MAFLSKILGDPNEKSIKKLQLIVDKIGGFEDGLKKLSNEELKNKTKEFKKQLNPASGEGKELRDILPEAYALTREVASRTLKQRHYDVQLMGGIVLHDSKIVEMKTGEGKTLASTAPIYLNALKGKGVHVVTVNDFLAKRDVSWMGEIYNAMGLSVGVITNDGSYLYDESYVEEVDDRSEEDVDKERDKIGSYKVEESYLRPCERKDAYGADITYGTNNEFGFDYLRDNLVSTIDKKVQRGHYFAIIDEIDSILIDEARTPLIISTPDTDSTSLYKTFARIVPNLKEGADYNVDYKMRAVSIAEKGIDKIERELDIKNLYDPKSGGGIRYVHNLEQALKAKVLFTRDKDYIVKEGQVVIVDEFTGRIMPGRRYSEGLHQAIEAKENVEVQRESRTVASITFQNYFRMYEKLAGMTGTAVTSAEEFDRVYKLEIVVVPTNKPLIREAMADLVFRTESGKFKAVVASIKELHDKGQPVLVGTTSIEKNEKLGALLKREGIKHELLNAKNHMREGSIIAQAGRKGAVTVATNMAGRGVDIILGGNPFDEKEAKKVRELGGLHVIGTERHEARRIDDQLRGRSGRQGDPGSSQFHVSLEDEIMRVFGGDKVKTMMSGLKMPEDQAIESKLVTNAIESAQSKIEGFNFDARKRLLEYDEVLNKHKEVIYKKRDKVLTAEDEEIKDLVYQSFESYLDKLLDFHLSGDHREDWNIEEIFEELRTVFPVDQLNSLKTETGGSIDGSFHKQLQDLREEQLQSPALKDKIREFIFKTLQDLYNKKEEEVGKDNLRKAERWLLLRTTDILWVDHLEALSYMRDSVRLQAYAQRDPLIEYKNEGLRLFKQLQDTIESDVVHSLFKLQVIGHQHEAQEGHTTSPKGGGVRPQKLNPSGSTIGKAGKEKIGRNDPCYCGSGKKYKKCHGKE